VSAFVRHFATVDAFRSTWEESLYRGDLFIPSEASPDIGDRASVTLTVGAQTVTLPAEVIGLESDLAGAPGVRVSFGDGQLGALRPFADAVMRPNASEGDVGNLDTAIPHDAETIERREVTSTRVRARGDVSTDVSPAAPPLDRTGVLQRSPAPIPLTGVVSAPAPLEPTRAGLRITPAGPGDGGGEGTRLAPGTVVDGRFQVDAHIGEGGMGEVYRASHVYLKRTVALKVLHRKLVSNQDAWARFQREAELVSQLEGPNIVRVFDFGRFSDGQPFLAMEFVEGEGLDRRLERGPSR
jgi:hypothetical protein